MGSTPMVALCIVIPTLVFQAMLIGSFQGEPEFPTFETSKAVCGGDLGDKIMCPFVWLVDLIKIVAAAASWFFGLISFNVAGAPWFIRVTVAFMNGGAIIWPIASLLRGGS